MMPHRISLARAIGVVLTLAASAAASAGLVGQQTIRLTINSGGGERQPVMSADGSTVVYGAIVAGSREIFTVPCDGSSAPTQHTTGADVNVGWSTFDAAPSLSISADGSVICYWNTHGVHVLDLRVATDTVIAPASLLPYPQISPDGRRVVYQDRRNGAMEVFVADTSGASAPRMISTNSGPGRRLPDVHGTSIVFQAAAAGGSQELFLFDMAGNTLSAALTAGSGLGNRYARFAHGGRSITFESVVANGAKEVSALNIATSVVTRLSAANRGGDRLPIGTSNDEVFFELLENNVEVQRADQLNGNVVALTSGTRAGRRRVSVDRSGRKFTFQAEHQGVQEVFVTTLCRAGEAMAFGVHGRPSTGGLRSFRRRYRCDVTLGLQTGLPAGGVGILLVGLNGTVLPVLNLPQTFLYVHDPIVLPVLVDANQALTATMSEESIPLGATFFYQWLVVDVPANRLGVVTSEGTRLRY